MSAPEKIGSKTWCECLCPCVYKKKQIRTYPQNIIETVAERSITVHPKLSQSPSVQTRTLDLQTVRHGRLNSQEFIPMEQALAWNGRYTIKEETPKKVDPDQINIKTFQ